MYMNGILLILLEGRKIKSKLSMSSVFVFDLIFVF